MLWNILLCMCAKPSYDGVMLQDTDYTVFTPVKTMQLKENHQQWSGVIQPDVKRKLIIFQ